jgi:hypothetical protein
MPGITCLQAKRDLVARLGALDRQPAVLELRLDSLRCVRLRGESGSRGDGDYQGGCENRRRGRSPSERPLA